MMSNRLLDNMAYYVSVENDTSLESTEPLRETLCPLVLRGRFRKKNSRYFHRRMCLTQIVSLISATTFELLKPVMNSGEVLELHGERPTEVGRGFLVVLNGNEVTENRCTIISSR
ncbi:hypothetical protein EVAR_6951_1 [Eumeta japonica]|uniref:Uncharacterized protein n=1 Tax=Eumeta variegata TaxID=151549 RepID=A0A4C1TGI8_EUMVA|nr:hypothetical protein EVAR_6951_1 [Eumeta japonica]